MDNILKALYDHFYRKPKNTPQARRIVHLHRIAEDGAGRQISRHQAVQNCCGTGNAVSLSCRTDALDGRTAPAAAPELLGGSQIRCLPSPKTHGSHYVPMDTGIMGSPFFIRIVSRFDITYLCVNYHLFPIN